MRIYDAFPTKALARQYADDLRKQGVQYVRVRENPSGGRLKWEIYIGGNNSSKF